MISIRPLRDEDIPFVLAIYNPYIRKTNFTLEEEELSLESFASRAKRIQARFPYIVAVNERGEVVGYAYLDLFHERSAYRRTADLSIYVDEKHLHEHIGGLLLSRIEDLAREQGFTNLVSIVTNENTNSMRFHLAKGFVEEGRLHDVAFKQGRLVDSIYYRKAL